MLTVTLQHGDFERGELIDFFLFYEIIKSHVMYLKIYQIQDASPRKPRDSMFDISAVYVCSFLLSQVLVVSLGDKTMHREQGNIISINGYFTD